MTRPFEMPATVLKMVFRTGLQVSIETPSKKAEVIALMNVKPDEVVRLRSLNAGARVEQNRQTGEVHELFVLDNEEVLFTRSEVVFFSVAEAVPPSGLVLPRKGLSIQ